MKVRRTPPTLFAAARRSFWVLFGGVWLLVGIPFFLIGVGTALEERRYGRDGVVAEATVLSKDITSRNDSRTYTVRYRFTTPDGEVIEDQAEVSLATWERLTERGSVPVVYLRGRPSASRVQGESQWALPAIFLFLGGTLTLLGGSVFVQGLRQAWVEVRLASGRGRSQPVR